MKEAPVPTELETDLLEASDQVYHKNVAIIQLAFNERLQDVKDEKREEFAEELPVTMEEKVNESTQQLRKELHAAAEKMIEEERWKQIERHLNILQFIKGREPVASRG